MSTAGDKAVVEDVIILLQGRVGGWALARNESGDWCSTGMGYLLHENVVFHSTHSMETLKVHKQTKKR